MLKVFRYSFLDLLRSRWTAIYFVFFALATGGLLYLSGDSTKVVISLLNVVILLVPLISMIYGLMYLYQVRDYVEVLLAQPLSRQSIFGGFYLGLAAALSLSALLGLGLPLLFFDLGQLFAAEWMVLAGLSVVLTLIFSALACWLVLLHENRLRGFGLGLFFWLFLGVIYDGIFLVLLVAFQAYPIENMALVLTLLNPIDMGRVLLIFQLDYSALMGFTGAVFERFFGSTRGSLIIVASLLIWIAVPVGLLLRKAGRKDF